jgi:hypothetical protein
MATGLAAFRQRAGSTQQNDLLNPNIDGGQKFQELFPTTYGAYSAVLLPWLLKTGYP